MWVKSQIILKLCLRFSPDCLGHHAITCRCKWSYSNVVGIFVGTLWYWWVYFHFCHIPSLEESLIRMAFLLHPIHTSITSPRVSVLSYMWLIFLFWWSSYFEEVTIKQVNNSSASIDFLQYSFYCDLKEDNAPNGSKVTEKSVNKWDGEQKEILANSIFSGDRGQRGNINGVLLGIMHHSNTF